jgi:small subunit ribosomal protein S6
LTKLYEAMFVMDLQSSADGGAMEAEIRRILDRAEAQVVICRRWEDRRLAYEIDGRKRGSYWLTYFNAAPDRVVGIERDVQLSERVLRILVTRAEQVPPEELAQPQAAEQPAEAPRAEATPVTQGEPAMAAPEPGADPGSDETAA